MDISVSIFWVLWIVLLWAFMQEFLGIWFSFFLVIYKEVELLGHMVILDMNNGHELGQTLGDGEGQRGLACCGPWGHKELDRTWQLNDNNGNFMFNILKGFQAVFQSDFPILYCHQKCMKVLISPNPYQHLLLSVFWIIAILCCCLVTKSLATPWTVAHQASLSMGFPRQEYWTRLPFPSPGEPPDPEIEPVSPALASGFFTTEPPGNPMDEGTWWGMVHGVAKESDMT